MAEAEIIRLTEGFSARRVRTVIHGINEKGMDIPGKLIDGLKGEHLSPLSKPYLQADKRHCLTVCGHRGNRHREL